MRKFSSVSPGENVLTRTIARCCCGIGVLVAVTACVCENEQLMSVSSPRETSRAVAFERNCGAMSGLPIIHVSVLKNGEKLGSGRNVLVSSGGGNVFVGDVGDAPKGIRPAADWVKLSWLADDSLLVSYASNVAPESKVQKVGSVRIMFSVLPDR